MLWQTIIMMLMNIELRLKTSCIGYYCDNTVKQILNAARMMVRCSLNLFYVPTFNKLKGRFCRT